MCTTMYAYVCMCIMLPVMHIYYTLKLNKKYLLCLYRNLFKTPPTNSLLII